jgi:hypothetical protein
VVDSFWEVDEIGIIVFVELVEFVEVDDEEAAIASTWSSSVVAWDLKACMDVLVSLMLEFVGWIWGILSNLLYFKLRRILYLVIFKLLYTDRQWKVPPF